MKKLMIGLVTLAAVVGATALPAMADSWFDGGIATGWPTAMSLSGGAWTNTDTAVFAESAVAFTNESSSALTFAAAERSPADGEVAISASVDFTPRTTLPVPTAKAGVIAYDNVFYVLAKDQDGAMNIWTRTTIAATPTATVNITFPSATTVKYKIGESTYDATIASVESVRNVKLSGIGKIGSLSGTAPIPPEPIDFSVTAPANATVAVYTNKVAEANLVKEGDTIWSNCTAFVVYKVTEAGKYFENGETEVVNTLDTASNPATDTSAYVPAKIGTPSVQLGVVAQRYPWNGMLDIQYKTPYANGTWGVIFSANGTKIGTAKGTGGQAKTVAVDLNTAAEGVLKDKQLKSVKITATIE